MFVLSMFLKNIIHIYNNFYLLNIIGFYLKKQNK